MSSHWDTCKDRNEVTALKVFFEKILTGFIFDRFHSLEKQYLLLSTIRKESCFSETVRSHCC